MTAEIPPIDHDHSRPSTELPPEYVREVIARAMHARADALIAHYADDEGAAESIRAARHRLRGHSLPRPGFTLDEQLEVVTILLSIEAIDALVRVIPRLALRRFDLLEAAATDDVPAAAWRDLSPGFLREGRLPPLLLGEQYRPPSAYLSTEKAEAPSGETVGQFQLWRNPDLYGFQRLLFGRNHETVQRLHESASRLGGATPEQVEEAYFLHLEREIRRAAFPFGLAEPEHRHSVAFAIAMTHESESVGSFHGVIRGATGLDPTGIPFDHALRSAFDALPARLRAQRSAGARPFGKFDLVRGAASAQSFFDTEPMARVRDDGWSALLARSGFGVPSPGDEVTPRQAYGNELLRLLPYSRSTALQLDALWPVGAVQTIISVTEEHTLDVTMATPFTIFVVHQLRDVVLDAYYAERIKNEQLGRRPTQATLGSVHSALEQLEELRANDVFAAARKRPLEVELTDADTADQAVGDPSDAIEPDDPALRMFTTPTWIEYFLDVLPVRRLEWQHAGMPGLPSVGAVKVLEAFTVWLRAEAEKRERPIVIAARALADAAKVPGEAQPLPALLQGHDLADDIGETLDDAVRAWAVATNTKRGTQVVKDAVRAIMTFSRLPSPPD